VSGIRSDQQHAGLRATNIVRSLGHRAGFIIQRALLAAYRHANAAGVLRSRFGWAVFVYGYRCYKRVVESPQVHRLRPFVPAGTTAIDVGAGFFVSYLARWVGPDGLVLAIEPEPENVRWLTSWLTATKSSRVDVLESAAAECSGRRHLAVEAHHPGGHRLAPEGLAIVAVSLDELLRHRVCPPVSFIKIDTQGAEMRVLLGARSTLRRTRPALWIELDAAALQAQGATPDDVVGLLEDEGYAQHEVGVWSGIRRLTREHVVCSCQTTSYSNVLFLPAPAPAVHASC
jgi:FkbM family methyltransferase